MAIPQLKAIVGADGKPLQKVLADATAQLKAFKAQVSDTSQPKFLSSLQTKLKESEQTLSHFGGHAKDVFSGLIEGFGLGAGISIFEDLKAGASSFFEGAQEEALKAARSVESLKQSLEAVGRPDLLASLIKDSKEVAERFKYLKADEVQAGFTKLIQFGGLTRKQINDLIPVIIDLNAKQRLAGDTNKTVQETTGDVVKALAGQGRALKQYGVEITAHMPLSERLNAVMVDLGDKVRGTADAFGNSLEGKIAASRVKFEELEKTIGEKILPKKVLVLQMISDIVDSFKLLNNILTLNRTQWEAWRDTLTYGAVGAKAGADELEKLSKLDMKASTSKLKEYNEELEKTERRIEQLNAKRAAAGSKYVYDPLTGSQGIKAGKGTFDDIDQDALDRAKVLKAKNEAIVEGLKKQIELFDKTKIGTNTTGDGKEKKEKDTYLEQLKKEYELKEKLAKLYPDELKYLKEANELQLKVSYAEAIKAGLSEDQAQDFVNAVAAGQIKGQKAIDAYLNAHPLFLNFNVKTNVEDVLKFTTGAKLPVHNIYKPITDQAEADGEDARKRIVDVNKILTANIENAGVAFGQSIAIAFQPGASGKDIAKPILTLLADVVEQIGKAILAAGTTMKAAKAAINKLWVNPVVAIAAGVGLIAVGEILKAAINNTGNNAVKKFADGGVVTGPTNALIGEKNKMEAVLPLEKIPYLVDRINGGGSNDGVLTTRVSGDDIVFIYDRRKKQQNRLR